ncbi:MAG TPA: hypothetical protein VMU75_02305 [Acidimicrobiales bacterium]|nr:hypothetical protein [Acidimicrobiales bacterium]
MSGSPFRRGCASAGVALAAILSIGLPGASASAHVGGAPVGKLYDCYSYNYQSGFQNYVQEIELKTSSIYLVASARKGDRLSGGVSVGRYREHGRSIKWLSGPYGQLHWTGVFHPAKGHPRPGIRPNVDAQIQLFDPQGLSPISCYELVP